MGGTESVGRRVVVRRVIDRSGERPKYSDVLGVLVASERATLTVRTADGRAVTIPRRDVQIVKQVAASTADILALEEVASLSWRAPDAEWLGRWLLRAAEGWTGRANSVLPLGDPGLPLDAALAQVHGWYAVRGLAPRFQVPLPARSALDEALAARGWHAHNPTRVLTADIEMALLAIPADAGLPPVSLEPTASDEWIGAYHYRGGTGVPLVAMRILTAADCPIFATVRDGGEVVAIARAAVDAGWVGITAVEVPEVHRRRGLATHVMRAVFEWARGAAATQVWLQVAADNAPALGLYQRLGFAEHHRYQYRIPG